MDPVSCDDTSPSIWNGRSLWISSCTPVPAPQSLTAFTLTHLKTCAKMSSCTRTEGGEGSATKRCFFISFCGSRVFFVVDTQHDAHVNTKAKEGEGAKQIWPLAFNEILNGTFRHTYVAYHLILRCAPTS